MKRTLPMILGVALLALPPLAVAAPGCHGCNILQEGVFGRYLVGQYLYEQGEKTGRFYQSKVLQVRMDPPAIYRQLPDGSFGWNHAGSFYTDASMRELVADAGGGPVPYRLTPMDERDRNSMLTACASYVVAVKDHNLAVEWLMRRACCESTASKRFGPPRGVC